MAEAAEAGAATGEVTRVSFVLIPRFNMMTLTMLMEPMRIANYLAPHKLYEWDFRATAAGQVPASNGLMVACRNVDEEGLPVLTQIRTFAGDVGGAVKSDGLSVAKVVIQEETKKREEAPVKAKTNFVFI